jgi:hypothetical protein
MEDDHADVGGELPAVVVLLGGWDLRRREAVQGQPCPVPKDTQES